MKQFWEIYFYLLRGNYPFFKQCPEEFHQYFIKKNFKLKNGYSLNLDTPKTFNEKIWWLLLNEDLSVKAKLTDKIEVKEWAKNIIEEEHISKTYQTAENADDINFDLLPDKFVLKASHGCRMNIIVQNKTEFLKKFREKAITCMGNWLNTNYYDYNAELQYKSIKPRILAEEYTVQTVDRRRTDYQIHCFNSEPVYIEHNWFKDGVCHPFLYNLDYSQTDFCFSYKYRKIPIEHNEHIEEMLDMARKLSKGFKYVRVDFRDCKDRVIFGEMTFSPFSGFIQFNPKEYDLKMGEKLIL